MLHVNTDGEKEKVLPKFVESDKKKLLPQLYLRFACVSHKCEKGTTCNDHNTWSAK